MSNGKFSLYILRCADNTLYTGITTDVGKRMAWPCPVDCHTHIDKGMVAARSANPDGTFAGAMTAAHEDREQFFSADDLRHRADFALRCAYASGTQAIRSHVDANPETFDAAFDVLTSLQYDWAGKVDVQLAPFAGLDADADWLEHMARTVLKQKDEAIKALSDARANFAGDEASLAQLDTLASQMGLE